MNKLNKFRRIPKIGHSKTQLILLSVICVFGIIFFYYLLIMLRVGLGMSLNLFSSYDNFIFKPSEYDTSFYNFITAIFAFIFGLSIFLKHLFNPIKQFKSKSFTSIKYRIISDVSILFTGFYMIAIKSLFFVFLIFDGLFPEDLDFGNTNLIWILFAIVLYLELWKTMLLIYGRKAIYKMILIALIGVLFSFGLSKINIYNFDNIYQTHTRSQIEYKYQIEYPESTYYRDNYRTRNYQIPIIIGYNINNKDKNRFPDIIYRGKKNKLENISGIIKSKYSQVSQIDTRRIIVNLNSDKNIKMKYINELKDSLSVNGINKINYRVLSNKTEDSFKLNTNYMIYEKFYGKLNKLTTNIPIPPKPLDPKKDRILKLTLINGDSVKFNSNIDAFTIPELQKFVLKDSKKYIFKLYFDETATLENYIATRAMLFTVITDFRNEYCLKYLDISYDELRKKMKHNPSNKLLRDKLRKVKDEFPIIISSNY